MSPSVYNEAIVKLHDNSFNYLNEKQEQIFDYENTSKEQATQIIDSLGIKFDEYVKYLDKIQYPDKAADWHKSTTQLITYVKDSIIPLYSETLKFEPESKDWYSLWKEVDKRTNGRANQLENQMIKEQEKFARAVNQRLR
ncbi:hypothetical protein FACS1894182_01170 [Bacteroidia bacterium]|nr:hypothetical protein FACS1894182_01170 [Bacteroidia bacterium]